MWILMFVKRPVAEVINCNPQEMGPQVVLRLQDWRSDSASAVQSNIHILITHWERANMIQSYSLFVWKSSHTHSRSKTTPMFPDSQVGFVSLPFLIQMQFTQKVKVKSREKQESFFRHFPSGPVPAKPSLALYMLLPIPFYIVPCLKHKIQGLWRCLVSMY